MVSCQGNEEKLSRNVLPPPCSPSLLSFFNSYNTALFFLWFSLSWLYESYRRAASSCVILGNVEKILNCKVQDKNCCNIPALSWTTNWGIWGRLQQLLVMETPQICLFKSALIKFLCLSFLFMFFSILFNTNVYVYAVFSSACGKYCMKQLVPLTHTHKHLQPSLQKGHVLALLVCKIKKKNSPWSTWSYYHNQHFHSLYVWVWLTWQPYRTYEGHNSTSINLPSSRFCQLEIS